MAYIGMEAKVNGAITIAGSQIVGDHVESAPYISGSTLRGALASIWFKKGNADNDEFLNIFCRGDVCFWGLFPVPTGADGTHFYENSYDHPSAYFPYRMPLSVFACKYDPGTGLGGHGYVDASIKEIEKCTQGNCGAPLKQCKSPDFYYWKGTPQPRAVAIEQKKEVHLYHGAERKVRRAKDASLYSYTSVSNDEGFIGWLVGDKNVLAQLQTKLAGEKDEQGSFVFRMCTGRGKKRRGFLQITMGETQEGTSFIPPYARNGNRIAAVLQTPAILNNERFGAKTKIDPVDIFGDLAKDLDICITDRGVFSRMTLIEGWSGVHGLPRKPDQAIAPGSTFVFQIGKDLDKEKERELEEKLNKFQKQGIGERRNEGYGRVLFNPPLNRNGG